MSRAKENSVSLLEETRKHYKPVNVKVIFIGESVPAAGTFFYTEDSLCSYTRRAFEKVYFDVPSTNNHFLGYFKEKGCYLDDLCLSPVDNLNKSNRKQKWTESVPSLANRLVSYRPQAIIVLLKSISESVYLARTQADMLQVPCYQTPFAGNGWQNWYIEELSAFLTELKDRRILA